MARGFLGFDIDEKQRITARSILKVDILPWILSAGLMTLLFVGIVLLVGSMDADQADGFAKASVTLYAFGIQVYYALVVVACLLARRSRSAWTWILAGILIVFFVRPSDWSLATSILPNSILPAMVAMIGLLAFGRIVEYIRMHYVLKLDQPTLSKGALTVYVAFVLGAILFDSSLVYSVFVH